jgi:hypothetical protein
VALLSDRAAEPHQNGADEPMSTLTFHRRSRTASMKLSGSHEAVARYREGFVKGIIFNLLERAVIDEHGEDCWDALLDATGSDGVFSALETYDDRELLGLVEAASKALNLPAADVVRWFGKSAIPLLADRYGLFFEPHDATIPFLLTLNDVIHTEVRKIYPGAEVPEFDFERRNGQTLAIEYRSHRKLCALAEGLIAGAAAHFGEHVSITHTQCMLQGAESCVLVCSFRRNVH